LRIRHAHGVISRVMTAKYTSPTTATGMCPKISDCELVVTFAQSMVPPDLQIRAPGWKCV